MKEIIKHWKEYSNEIDTENRKRYNDTEKLNDEHEKERKERNIGKNWSEQDHSFRPYMTYYQEKSVEGFMDYLSDNFT